MRYYFLAKSNSNKLFYKQTATRNWVVLSYTKGIFEKIARMLSQHNIKAPHKPVGTVVKKIMELPVTTHLLSACGRLAMTGPYPGELSYSSNNGAATNL